MSIVTSFDIRKFSKFIVDSSEAPLNTWYHYPHRTSLSITFIRGSEHVDLFIYYKGSCLQRIKIYYDDQNYQFIQRYPSIGFKKTRTSGRIINRFQISFISKDEFDKCSQLITTLGLKLKKFSREADNSQHDILSQSQNVSQVLSQSIASSNRNSIVEDKADASLPQSRYLDILPRVEYSRHPSIPPRYSESQFDESPMGLQLSYNFGTPSQSETTVDSLEASKLLTTPRILFESVLSNSWAGSWFRRKGYGDVECLYCGECRVMPQTIIPLSHHLTAHGLSPESPLNHSNSIEDREKNTPKDSIEGLLGLSDAELQDKCADLLKDPLFDLLVHRIYNVVSKPSLPQ